MFNFSIIYSEFSYIYIANCVACVEMLLLNELLCVCVWFDRFAAMGVCDLKWEIGPCSPISPVKCSPFALLSKIPLTMHTEHNTLFYCSLCM